MCISDVFPFLIIFGKTFFPFSIIFGKTFSRFEEVSLKWEIVFTMMMMHMRRRTGMIFPSLLSSAAKRMIRSRTYQLDKCRKPSASARIQRASLWTEKDIKVIWLDTLLHVLPKHCDEMIVNDCNQEIFTHNVLWTPGSQSNFAYDQWTWVFLANDELIAWHIWKQIVELCTNVWDTLCADNYVSIFLTTMFYQQRNVSFRFPKFCLLLYFLAEVWQLALFTAWTTTHTRGKNCETRAYVIH